MAVVAIDDFPSNQLGLISPATKAFAITPSDTDQLAHVTRWLYVGGAGDLSVQLRDDSAPVVLKAVPLGSFLRIRATQVTAANTTATNLVGLY